MVASRLGSFLGGPKHFSCLTDPHMVVLHTLAETVETDSVSSPDPLAAAALPLEPNKPLACIVRVARACESPQPTNTTTRKPMEQRDEEDGV